LKARAWLDLSARAAMGQKIDSRDIRKHRNDVLRLFAIADPEYRASPVPAIRSDMSSFIEQVRDETIDLKSFGLPGPPLESLLDALRRTYVEPDPAGGDGSTW